MKFSIKGFFIFCAVSAQIQTSFSKDNLPMLAKDIAEVVNKIKYNYILFKIMYTNL